MQHTLDYARSSTVKMDDDLSIIAGLGLLLLYQFRNDIGQRTFWPAIICFNRRQLNERRFSQSNECSWTLGSRPTRNDGRSPPSTLLLTLFSLSRCKI
jgi:hypothetical protein